MATTPTSVRVDEDKLDQFKQMQRDLGGGAEFADWALEMYKMHQSTKTSDQFAKDIQGIEGMMQAIAGAINGIVSRAEGVVLAKGESIKEELAAKDQESGDLKGEIELLRQEVKAKDEEISNRDTTIKDVQTELKETRKLLEKAQKDYDTTVELNKVLVKEQVRYKAIEDDNKQLAVDNKALAAKLADAEKQATKDRQIIATLETDKLATEQRYAEMIKSLEDKHRQSLDHAEALKDVEISKAVLGAREEAQAKIDAQIEAQNQLRQELDQSRKEVYAINNIIRDMQDAHFGEVSKLKEIHNKEVAGLKLEIEAFKSSRAKIKINK